MTLGFLYVFYSRGLSDLLLRARAARIIPPRADAKQRFVASLGVQIAAIWKAPGCAPDKVSPKEPMSVASEDIWLKPNEPMSFSSQLPTGRRFDSSWIRQISRGKVRQTPTAAIAVRCPPRHSAFGAGSSCSLL